MQTIAWNVRVLLLFVLRCLATTWCCLSTMHSISAERFEFWVSKKIKRAEIDLQAFQDAGELAD